MSMQTEKTEDDQANELRNVLQAIEQESDSNDEHVKARDEDDIDVLNLPPRKEIHTNKKRAGIKFSRPFIRFICFTLIILLCLGAAFYIWQGELTSLLHRL